MQNLENGLLKWKLKLLKLPLSTTMVDFPGKNDVVEVCAGVNDGEGKVGYGVLNRNTF